MKQKLVFTGSNNREFWVESDAQLNVGDRVGLDADDYVVIHTMVMAQEDDDGDLSLNRLVVLDPEEKEDVE